MKVRIGYGLGTRSLTNDAARFNDFVDALEGHGFDSLWLSERITGDCPDPLIGLAVAAGRTRKLKLGTSVQVLPGRNPVLVAKEWASLDRLSNGRALPAFGLGVADPREQQAFGVERGERAKWFDEALPLMRRLWTEDSVDHDGARFHYEALSVRPKPMQQPLDVWLGGIAPSELKRIGRLADGWLPSFCTPADVERSRPIVEEAAAAAGRTFDDEHWGALIAYADGPIPDLVATALAARRPDLADPAEVIAAGLDGLHARIEDFVRVGTSKFVVPSPVVALNRAVAIAMADGPAAGLALVDVLEPALHEMHLFHSTRAHLLERLGRRDEAAAAYERAARLTANQAERTFLEQRLAGVRGSSDG